MALHLSTGRVTIRRRLVSSLSSNPLPELLCTTPALHSRPTPCTALSTTCTARLLHTTRPQNSERRGWMVRPRGWNTRNEKFAWHSKYNEQDPRLPTLKASAAAALARKENSTPRRCGVLAVKKGMTSVFRYGKQWPATILKLEGCTVVANMTPEKRGYWAVQVGSGSRHESNVPRAQLGYFEARGIHPVRHLVEFRVRNAEGLLPVGAELWPDWFHRGQYVDTRSESRGMGFAGVMKRHGFSGQPASHGNSLNHRTMGSAGPSQGSGSRVHPGKKMAGRMGGQRVTVHNLQVLEVDNDLGTILVDGPVAGPKGCLVQIQDAKMKARGMYQSHAVKALERLKKRFPHAESHLIRARELHLKLKTRRQLGVSCLDHSSRDRPPTTTHVTSTP